MSDDVMNSLCTYLCLVEEFFFLGFLYSSFGWVDGIWQVWIFKLF